MAEELKKVKLLSNSKTYDAVVDEERGYVDIKINEAVSRRFRINEVELLKKE